MVEVDGGVELGENGMEGLPPLLGETRYRFAPPAMGLAMTAKSIGYRAQEPAKNLSGLNSHYTKSRASSSP